MYTKLGLQLYSIRDFMQTEADIRESFHKIKAMGYDQVQTAGCAVPYDVFGALAKEAGLEIVGTHDDFNKMQNDLPTAIREHKALGTTNMGVGGMAAVTTMEGIEEQIAACNAVADALKGEGFKFTYHNHRHEFVRVGDKTRFDYYLEGFKDNISFVLDTYWAQHAGVDVCSLMKKMEGRIDILHLKDMAVKGNDPYITECGHGNLNFADIIPLAESIGVKYLVVEQDICPGDPFESVRFSSEYLHKNFLK